MPPGTLDRLSPYVRLVHDYETSPGWHLPRRRINDHALLYFRRGRGTFVVGKRNYLIAPGTLFVIRPDVAHEVGPSVIEPFHMLNVHFDLVERPDSSRTAYHRTWDRPNPRRRLETFVRERDARSGLPVRMKIAHAAAYEHLFQGMASLFALNDLPNRLGRKAALIQLLAFLFRQVRAQAISRRLLQHLPRLELAARLMGRTLHRPLELVELARTASLSRSSFARSFREYYGITPAKFHLERRIQGAASALTLDGLSVKEATEAFGFRTVHHFSRCFRRAMGLPPAAYRWAHRSVPGQG